MKLVLTLGPALVAEVLGCDHDEALTLEVNGTSYLPPAFDFVPISQSAFRNFKPSTFPPGIL